MGTDPNAIQPAAHLGAVSGVGSAKVRGECALLRQDLKTCDVGRKRQRPEQRPGRRQVQRQTQQNEHQPKVHGVARHAVDTVGHQFGAALWCHRVDRGLGLSESPYPSQIKAGAHGSQRQRATHAQGHGQIQHRPHPERYRHHARRDRCGNHWGRNFEFKLQNQILPKNSRCGVQHETYTNPAHDAAYGDFVAPLL